MISFTFEYYISAFISKYIWVILHAKIPKLTQWLANPPSSQIWKKWGGYSPLSRPYSATLVSYLPTNWLDKLEEVNGDSITNKESILYTKSILHTRPNSRAWDILCMSSFSVGQWIEGSIRTFRDNICKFIVYILLILQVSFLKWV